LSPAAGDSINISFITGRQVRSCIFDTHGERMRVDDGHALPTFLNQALRDEPVTVYGDGSQTRSFCYVSDLADGLIKLLLPDQTGPVNLGNRDEIRLLSLAKAVIGQTASHSTIVFEPLPVDGPTRRFPDISRASKILNWQPPVGLRGGIERVIPYFRAQLGA
jgi:dTDP-glucose 4,6-dehydratase